ncbi:MAG TPA: hypothetical protein VMW27_12720 [Thermoanaerobaculia bacterium]|nr:hypothetical protein [Thermoanaerobaculia bacterium]
MSEGPQYTSCVDKAVWKSVLATIGAANIIVASAAVAAIVAGLVFPPAALVGLILAIATGAQILRKVAGWLLNGKLICMQNAKRRVFSDPDPDRVCVLGTILDFEQVGEDKSGFELIDNDFAVNLLLAPLATADVIAAKDLATLRSLAENGPQGDLIQNPQPPAVAAGDPPAPPALVRKDDPTKLFGPMPAGFTGYDRGLMFSKSFPRAIPSNAFRDPRQLVKVDPMFQALADAARDEYLAPFQGPGPVIVNGQTLTDAQRQDYINKATADPFSQPIIVGSFKKAVDAAFDFKEKRTPVLHCEFEGSRISDVFGVLDVASLDCGGGFLGFLCDLLNILISIFLGLPLLIAAIVAWASADDGALSDAYDGASGELRWGDPIVVRGRWSYDGGHSGYNEIHAVRTVQKTFPPPQDCDAWCGELSKVPPSPPPERDPAGAPSTPPPPPPVGGPPPPIGQPPMNARQKETWDAQQRDENRWVYHPAIDGCVPAALPIG